MIYLYAFNTKEYIFEEEISYLYSILSMERKEKSKRYRNKIDQIRCILGEVLLKYILWKHYKIPLEKIQFQYNEYGKPSLFHFKEIDFNISHSGEWILCGVSNNLIGIDVEGNNKKDTMSIAKRFFTKEEYNYIMNELTSNQLNAFYKIWTLKESYIKCIGKGLSLPLNSFSFEFSNDNIQMYENGVLNQNYSFHSINLNNGYYIAICSFSKEFLMFDHSIQILSIDEIFKFYNFVSQN